VRTTLLFVLGLLVAGCDSGPNGAPADPSYASDVQPIFNSRCVGCHGGSSPSQGYSLTSRAGAMGNGSDTLPNVVAGSANSSTLYRRVAGLETPQMPFGQAPLDEVKQQTIKNWINKGAKDN
jgi:hypothetical protein